MKTIPANIANKLRLLLDDDIPYDIANFDIYKFTKLCGGKVVYNDSFSYDAHIIKRNNNEFIIEVNPDKSEERKRFAIAHELGHWFLHIGNDFDNNIFKRSKNVSYAKTELEANQFAEELLMPHDNFKNKLYEVQNKYDDFEISLVVEDVSKIFGVPYDRAYGRGKNLGLWN